MIVVTTTEASTTICQICVSNATDPRAKHRMVCEQLIHLQYTCEANSKRRRLSGPPCPSVQMLLAPNCDAGESSPMQKLVQQSSSLSVNQVL